MCAILARAVSVSPSFKMRFICEHCTQHTGRVYGRPVTCVYAAKTCLKCTFRFLVAAFVHNTALTYIAFRLARDGDVNQNVATNNGKLDISWQYALPLYIQEGKQKKFTAVVALETMHQHCSAQKGSQIMSATN